MIYFLTKYWTYEHSVGSKTVRWHFVMIAGAQKKLDFKAIWEIESHIKQDFQKTESAESC